MTPVDRYQVDILFQRMVSAYVDLMDSPLAKRLEDCTHQYQGAKRQLDKQDIEAEGEE